MQSENNAVGQKRRSFIEEARRAQIIQSAVETFAELGYANTSLTRIAERAGISKGAILYHFAGKNELIEQLVESVYGDIIAFVLPRIERETTATGALRARIRSVAEYVRGHPAQLLALGEILNNSRNPDGKPRYGIASNEPLYQAQEEGYRLGQQTGEFRAFDPRVMAVTVQAAIDSMIAYWATYPDHDLEAHANELADLFEHATRADRPGETATQ